MSKSKLLPVIALGILILALPVTLILVKQRQDQRSGAAAADKLEAEGGVLGGNAILTSDSNASGGSYVVLNQNVSPTPTSSPNTPTPTVSQSSSSGFGPQPVASTPLSQATKFVSPNGSGTACSQTSPCSLKTGADTAVPGNVVFMRGGVYMINDYIYFDDSNAQANYIIFESYPGENAILDGTNAPLVKDYLRAYGEYYKFRKFEVRNFPGPGIFVFGTHNILDGIYVHHNKGAGIQIYGSGVTDGSLGSYNTLQNITATDNSDVGLTCCGYNDGNNADGIAVSGGTENEILYSYATRNSDDGFDIWRSLNSSISYSLSTDNGRPGTTGIPGGGGNGIGFKLGGLAPSDGGKIDHSLSWKNMTAGFDPNGGENVTIDHVTAWDNGEYGIYAYPTTIITNSISVDNFNDQLGTMRNIIGSNGPTTGTQTNNSWQRSGTPAFISTNPSSPNFLKPTVGGGFENIGAYTN